MVNNLERNFIVDNIDLIIETIINYVQFLNKNLFVFENQNYVYDYINDYEIISITQQLLDSFEMEYNVERMLKEHKITYIKANTKTEHSTFDENNGICILKNNNIGDVLKTIHEISHYLDYMYEKNSKLLWLMTESLAYGFELSGSIKMINDGKYKEDNKKYLRYIYLNLLKNSIFLLKRINNLESKKIKNQIIENENLISYAISGNISSFFAYYGINNSIRTNVTKERNLKEILLNCNENNDHLIYLKKIIQK